MMRRHFKKLLLIIAILTGLMMSYCNMSVLAEDKEVLRIAAQPYPLYANIWAAKDLGYIDEELGQIGAGYTWNTFQSGPLVNEALAAGDGDIGFAADLPAINAKSSGQDVEIVSNVAYGEKALAILVPEDSEISSVAELEGKKVAYAVGTYAQHLLALLLNQEGLNLDDVQSVNLGAGDQVTALKGGQVDAIVIWEQFISQLTSEGTARVLADGTGVKRGNMVNYAVKSYVEEHPDVIVAFLRAVQRGSDYIDENPEDAASLLAPDLNVDAEVVIKIFGNLTYEIGLTDEDIAAIEEVKDFSYETGIIQNDFDFDSFITTEYVDKALGSFSETESEP